MAGWSSYTNGNDGTFLTEFGTTGYRIINKESRNGMYRNFNLVNSGTYTFSARFRYRTGTAANNGATVYISNYGASDTAGVLNKTIVGEWQYVSHTVNVTSPTNVYFYLISYGGNYGAATDFSTWDVTMPQIEFKDHRTPYTNSTRTATQGLLDTLGNYTVDITNMSFDANATMVFDGIDDYVNTNYPVQDQANWTMSAWIYDTKANGGYRSIIQVNLA